MDFFSPENKFMSMLNSAVDFILLNLLAIVCSIPVVTIGAAATAKYYVAMKIMRGEAPAIAKSFFKSFKENFRQSLGLEVIAALLLAVMAGDWYVVFYMDMGNLQTPVFVIAVLFTVIAAFIYVYLFPLLARFRFTNREIVKYAFMIAVTNFGNTLLLVLYTAIVYGASLYLFPLLPVVYFVTSTVALLLGSAVYVRVFRKFEPKEETEGENGEDPGLEMKQESEETEQ